MGRQALANGLWEVAAAHFERALESESTSKGEKPELRVRLAESVLRGGEADRAILILKDLPSEGHPEASFWQAQALAQKGHYLEAIELLDARIEDTNLPYHSESILSSANLRCTFGQEDLALRLLESIKIEPESPETVLAVLRRIEILLERGHAESARALFPDLERVPSSLLVPAKLLEGRLFLLEARFTEATSRFRALLGDNRTTSSQLYELAALGLTDSLISDQKPQEASTFLVQFIQNNPEAKHLPAFFRRLIPLLPPRQSSDDPSWQPIATWAGEPSVPATGFVATRDTDASGALPMETTPPNHEELTFQSLFTLYLGWQNSTLPQAIKRRRYYANRLLTEAPTHQLTQRLLLELATKSGEDGNPGQALEWVDTIRPMAQAEHFKGKSHFLKGRLLWEQGRMKSAGESFLMAARVLDQANSTDALFNASLIQLIQHQQDPEDPSAPPPSLPAPIVPDLAIETALATADPEEKRALLEKFLIKHPDHERMPEARLAAADTALAIYPPDLGFANAQIETINSLPKHQQPPADEIQLRTIRILDQQGDSEAVISLATEALKKGPDGPNSSELMFLLGRNLYQTGNYNDARLALQRLTSLDENPQQTQACWLLSARAAALVATQQSKLEAVELFEKAINIDGPLSSVARLEKARLLIDLNKAKDAEALLKAWFESLPPDHPALLPAGFQLAEAIRSNGTPEAFESAMTIYDKLLEVASDTPSAYHRLQYLRGLTFEQMGDPETGVGKRVRRAFVAYYSVLETDTPPTEWYYFELCGFKALSMLIESGRWPAAITCARRIASFNGPRAKEAEEIASQLQLKHMIWEEESEKPPEKKPEE